MLFPLLLFLFFLRLGLRTLDQAQSVCGHRASGCAKGEDECSSEAAAATDRHVFD
jgi:hypothetical protein